MIYHGMTNTMPISSQVQNIFQQKAENIWTLPICSSETFHPYGVPHSIGWTKNFHDFFSFHSSHLGFQPSFFRDGTWTGATLASNAIKLGGLVSIYPARNPARNRGKTPRLKIFLLSPCPIYWGSEFFEQPELFWWRLPSQLGHEPPGEDVSMCFRWKREGKWWEGHGEMDGHIWKKYGKYGKTDEGTILRPFLKDLQREIWILVDVWLPMSACQRVNMKKGSCLLLYLGRLLDVWEALGWDVAWCNTSKDVMGPRFVRWWQDECLDEDEDNNFEVGEAMAPESFEMFLAAEVWRCCPHWTVHLQMVAVDEKKVCQTDPSIFRQGPYLFRRRPPENDLLME